MRTCTHPTESGECTQTVYDSPELRQVRYIIDSPVDVCFYHQRVVLGRLQQPASYLSLEELDATMGGRPHGDGRRLDQYVLEARRRVATSR